MLSLVINEINADAPNERGEFIELKAVEFLGDCASTTTCNLTGYFVAILKGFDQRLMKPSILAVIDLSEEVIRKERPYFVIGDEGVANVGVQFSSSKVQLRLDRKDARLKSQKNG